MNFLPKDSKAAKHIFIPFSLPHFSLRKSNYEAQENPLNFFWTKEALAGKNIATQQKSVAPSKGNQSKIVKVFEPFRRQIIEITLQPIRYELRV